MPFPESFLQELADRNDIVELVGSYLPLTLKSGSYWGRCPFHSEKTPSFHVLPDRQFYHCFGCGKGGGAIQFVMEMENLAFPDAVAFLAKRAGLELPQDAPDENRHRRERMLAANRDAARFFFEQRTLPSGKPAQDYMLRRGITPATAKRFGLGFAPDTWDSLKDAMRAKGYTEEELLGAGLVKRGKNGGVYDAFRDRLMFPVIDVRGSVIGFSGRILGDGEPKYLNSPETLVFNKSRNLFALNLAKKSKSGYLILSEGNIDVVSLHQAGIDSAVASLGTSLTAEQARLMSRYTGEVILAYDADGAGQKASQRAIGLLEKLDVRVRVLELPEGKDPDEYIKLRGADAFRNLLEKTENHIQYRMQRLRSGYDLGVDEQKAAYVKAAAALIASLPGKVDREVYAMRLADETGVNKAVIRDEAERERKRQLSRAKQSYEREVTRPAVPARSQSAVRYENKRSAKAEEGIVRLYCQDPSLFDGVDVTPEDFTSPLLARFFTALRGQAVRNVPFSLDTLSEDFSGEELGHLAGLLETPEVPAGARQALADYIEIMQAEKQTGSADEDLMALAERKRNTKRYGG